MGNITISARMMNAVKALRSRNVECSNVVGKGVVFRIGMKYGRYSEDGWLYGAGFVAGRGLKHLLMEVDKEMDKKIGL